MLVIHCIAKAKLLDIETDKIVVLDIVEQKNHKKEVMIDTYLQHLILKKMNKNKKSKQNDMSFCDTALTICTTQGFNATIRNNEWKELEFTYAEKGDAMAVSLTNKMDKFNAKRGADIACGRVNAALDYRAKKRKRCPLFSNFKETL